MGLVQERYRPLPRVIRSIALAAVVGAASISPDTEVVAHGPKSEDNQQTLVFPEHLDKYGEILFVAPHSHEFVLSQEPVRAPEVNPYLGIRNDDPSYIGYMDELRVGAVKLAGNWSDVGEDGRLDNKNIEQMLEKAKDRNLKVVYTFVPGLLIDREEIARRIRPVVANYNVILELGNEPDDTGFPYWEERDLRTFAEFVRRASEEAWKINPETEISVSALIDVEATEELLAYFRELNVDISRFMFSVHAYHDPEDLERRVEYVKSLTGRPVLLTEIGVDSYDGADPNKTTLVKMIQKGVELTGLPVIIHQLKRHPSHNTDHVYGLVEPSTRKPWPIFYAVKEWSTAFFSDAKKQVKKVS